MKKELGQRSILLAAAYLVFSAAAVAPVFAQSHEKPFFRYGLSETGVWNSNPLMQRDGYEDIYGSETRAFIGLQREMATSKIILDLSALRNQYIQSEYSSTDFYAKAALEKQLQNWRFALDGTYDFDTTRSSEISTLGRNVGLGRRKAINLEPSVSYNQSERATLGLGARLNEVRYDTDNLSDYRISALTPFHLYNLTPLQIVMVTFQAQRYELIEGDGRIDSLGPAITWRYRFHPLWNLNLSGGSLASKISDYGSDNGDWETNLIYSATLEYQGLRHNTSLAARRSRQPYANGTEAILTTIEARNLFKINQKVELDLKGSYQFAKQPPIETDNLDKAWNAGAGLSYKLSPEWAVDASYKYRAEQIANDSRTAEQQIMRIGLTYRFGSIN